MLLRLYRIGLLRINPEIHDGFLYDRRMHFATLGQARKRRDHDALGVNFEKSPQRFAIFATAKAIGAQRMQTARDPAGNHFRHRLHVVAGRDE